MQTFTPDQASEPEPPLGFTIKKHLLFSERIGEMRPVAGRKLATGPGMR